jgi:hypothetical protein
VWAGVYDGTKGDSFDEWVALPPVK